VEIEGANFINSGRLTCRFGDIDVPAIRFISSEVILCRTPPGIGKVMVTISNNDHNFTQQSDATYTYINTDQLFHMNPWLGPISGNTSVIIEA
jgi:hypothetical protein